MNAASVKPLGLVSLACGLLAAAGVAWLATYYFTPGTVNDLMGGAGLPWASVFLASLAVGLGISSQSREGRNLPGVLGIVLGALAGLPACMLTLLIAWVSFAF